VYLFVLCLFARAVCVVLLLIGAYAGAFLAEGRLAYPHPQKSLGFDRAEGLRKFCGKIPTDLYRRGNRKRGL
jgi:hypothetical protein